MAPTTDKNALLGGLSNPSTETTGIQYIKFVITPNSTLTEVKLELPSAYKTQNWYEILHLIKLTIWISMTNLLAKSFRAQCDNLILSYGWQNVISLFIASHKQIYWSEINFIGKGKREHDLILSMANFNGLKLCDYPSGIITLGLIH